MRDETGDIWEKEIEASKKLAKLVSTSHDTGHSFIVKSTCIICMIIIAWTSIHLFPDEYILILFLFIAIYVTIVFVILPCDELYDPQEAAKERFYVKLIGVLANVRFVDITILRDTYGITSSDISPGYTVIDDVALLVGHKSYRSDMKRYLQTKRFGWIAHGEIKPEMLPSVIELYYMPCSEVIPLLNDSAKGMFSPGMIEKLASIAFNATVPDCRDCQPLPKSDLEKVAFIYIYRAIQQGNPVALSVLKKYKFSSQVELPCLLKRIHKSINVAAKICKVNLFHAIKAIAEYFELMGIPPKFNLLPLCQSEKDLQFIKG